MPEFLTYNPLAILATVAVLMLVVGLLPSTCQACGVKAARLELQRNSVTGQRMCKACREKTD